MITALFLAVTMQTATGVSTKTEAVSLVPVADVWVYPNASEPEKDPFLRVWGAEGVSVADSGKDASNFSYSYLKFDLSSLTQRGKPIKAILTLHHVADPAFSVEDAKLTPLEARAVSPTFEEKGWAYEKAAKIPPVPGKDGLYGLGFPQSIPFGKEFPIQIDLTRGDSKFLDAFEKARKEKRPLAIALTTIMEPADRGVRFVYKVYSKDTEKPERRPVLQLVFSG